MKYELIVIGGGSAGHSAARTAAAMGLECALIEAPGPLGGLCILRGCMPSKILIETANRMREAREAPRFGFSAGEPRLDVSALRARLDELGRDFREYRANEMKESGYDLIRGTASFTSPHDLRILAEDGSSTMLTAQAFVIATGSSTHIPDIARLAGTPYWTSDDLVKLPDPPEQAVILGGGAIALEAAHLLEGFGSAVTLAFRKKHIMDGHDPDLVAALEAETREHGITLLPETGFTSVHHSQGKFHLTRKTGGVLVTDALIVATGRRPNTKDLGLQEIGLAMDHDLILIDDRCATSASHIFAAGDCASPVPVVHLAVIQGEVAAKNAERRIRDGHSELSSEWPHDSIMSGLFTDPQCVEIGLGVTEAEKKGIPVITGRVDYNDQGKGMIAGSRHGFVKIIAERETRRIVGAAGVGPQVLETSHVVQLAIAQGLTLEEYAAAPHYHPTLSEAWQSAAQAAIDSHPME